MDGAGVTGRVAVLSAPKRFVVEHAAPATPAAGEVLVRVVECGICGSDLKMWAGTHAFMRPPIVMGHEVVGVVESVGEGVALEQGQAVTLFPPVGCGDCFHCTSGHEQRCEDMEFFGGQRAGGLADFLLAPASHVLPIPATVPAELRVLIEPLSVAVHGVARAAPGAGDRCAVVGAGTIGLFTALVLGTRGVEQIVVADVLSGRLARAKAAGFDVVDVGRESIREGVSRLIRPEGADLVFECVGSQETIDASLASTRKGGTTVVVGNAPAQLAVDGLALQRGDRSLVGVLMYEYGDFRIAMDLAAGGLFDRLDRSSLVARYELDRIDDAFVAANTGSLTALKAAVCL